MGRKNRMKSTFINQVIPGTLWLCHTNDTIIIDHRLTKIYKGDFVIVLGILDTIIPDCYVVEAFSQKNNFLYTTPLEDFYKSYRQIN